LSSLVWLALTAILVVAVALAHRGPKGGKPVANTRLMKTARYVLILGAIGCGLLGVFGAIQH
jgi:hypothetical protein